MILVDNVNAFLPTGTLWHALTTNSLHVGSLETHDGGFLKNLSRFTLSSVPSLIYHLFFHTYYQLIRLARRYTAVLFACS